MLYFCEYSLHFFKRRSQMLRHMRKCRVRHPPGEEIYRHGNVCMFEVRARHQRSTGACVHELFGWSEELYRHRVVCARVVWME